VAAIMAHMGEESIISGRRGSGTLFFSGCNLGCVFCQNYDISQECSGKGMSVAELAESFLKLEKAGVHNINLVSPSHFADSIVKAIKLAKKGGIALPFVYNSGGYDSFDMLKKLDGLIDIYMPDFKFADNAYGQKYSGVPDYFDVAKKAVVEMQRQVGAPVVKDGIMQKGLLVRHLVMPGLTHDSVAVLDWAKKHVPNAIFNIMGQYRPAYQAHRFAEINRRPTGNEYRQVVEHYKKLQFPYAHLLSIHD
jgi:putative pyruvate formate lyase activating enzyme